jgi:DNA-binding transcriptional LysR family regulator
MRQADIAIRLRQPVQAGPHPAPAVHRAFPRLCVAGLPEALRPAGELEDLDRHRIMAYGGTVPPYLMSAHWLSTAGRDRRIRARTTSSSTTSRR